ncbi:MAG: 2,3-bisphosphoglycerate-independent phosphoglycerate mutase [Bacteroidetes bacterium]|nr:2,3-bisphosphoglycerate-independent phosphoglycerate mutase [Bacteroidota bacterium]MDA1288411.1 2,3-bisphosphoglycerate-independent phosphoglycerate mutase [Bacteroidota bacterium]
MSQKTLLMILDGWGMAPDKTVSAVDIAHTPYIDSLYAKYSHATLRTDGKHVGLPEGQMGNSEVGHMNLGAGRIVYQDLAKINLAVTHDRLREEKVLTDALRYAQKEGKKVHLLGLLSDGGVHSHINHLKGLLSLIAEYQLPKVFVHGFTDGRDVDPLSGKGFVSDLETTLKQTGGQLASLIGRYYAMDRDQRWERVKLAYDLLIHGKGTPTQNFEASLSQSYKEGVTDEFIKPLFKADASGNPITTLEEGDVVLFFNFRTDRGRELTQVLSQKAFPEFDMLPLSFHYVTLTNYDDSFEKVHVIFDKDNLENTLGEVLSKAGKTQVRIAETEKYPHVTFFFNGGREIPFEGEERILCPSPKVATYDLKPEMSAYEIRDAIVAKINEAAPDFICLNFANPDMVGHTGDLNAAVKACETVDQCAKDVIEAALEQHYAILVIADHGNCETMINPDGSPNTAHTTNPVPLILVDGEHKKIKSGILGDIAPTLLDLMEIEPPKTMTQHSLLIKP